MRKISYYQVINHGVEGEQYFQGCGLANGMNIVRTGVGDSEQEAFNDAIEQLYECGYDVSVIEKDYENKFSDETVITESMEEMHVYISIRVRVER